MVMERFVGFHHQPRGPLKIDIHPSGQVNAESPIRAFEVKPHMIRRPVINLGRRIVIVLVIPPKPMSGSPRRRPFRPHRLHNHNLRWRGRRKLAQSYFGRNRNIKIRTRCANQSDPDQKHRPVVHAHMDRFDCLRFIQSSPVECAPWLHPVRWPLGNEPRLSHPWTPDSLSGNNPSSALRLWAVAVIYDIRPNPHV